MKFRNPVRGGMFMAEHMYPYENRVAVTCIVLMYISRLTEFRLEIDLSYKHITPPAFDDDLSASSIV